MSTDVQPDRILKVVAIAMHLGRQHLSPYGSVKSRHDFTQPQLMACLILRTDWKTTYRGAVQQLAVSAEVREAIGLGKLPNYSTLKKFADRQGVVEVMHAMLTTLAKRADEADESFCKEAAMDATGLPATCASAHFESRRGKRQKRYVKVGVVVRLGSLVPALMALGWGPGNDKTQAGELIDLASASVTPDLTDRKFDFRRAGIGGLGGEGFMQKALVGTPATFTVAAGVALSRAPGEMAGGVSVTGRQPPALFVYKHADASIKTSCDAVRSLTRIRWTSS